ncbi:MAG: hypothetical protein WCO99_10105 [Planctomycetota bacterium]
MIGTAFANGVPVSTRNDWPGIDPLSATTIRPVTLAMANGVAPSPVPEAV